MNLFTLDLSWKASSGSNQLLQEQPRNLESKSFRSGRQGGEDEADADTLEHIDESKNIKEAPYRGGRNSESRKEETLLSMRKGRSRGI